jgi:hypothetical protein
MDSIPELMESSNSENTCSITDTSTNNSSSLSAAAASSSSSSASAPPSSRYENQKRRDWNTFGQYLKNHRPPLSLSRCSGAHVLEFLRYNINQINSYSSIYQFIYVFISTGTLTNLARQRCTLQSAPSMATLTLRRLALARCGRRGVALMPSSAASVPPSKRTEGSRKQTLLGLEQLGSIFVRFVICSQKQGGSAMRKRRGSAPGNSCRRRSCRCRPHQEVQVYKNSTLQQPPLLYCKSLKMGTTFFLFYQTYDDMVVLSSVFRVQLIFSKLAIIYRLSCLYIFCCLLQKQWLMDLVYHKYAFDANSVSITISRLVVPMGTGKKC